MTVRGHTLSDARNGVITQRPYRWRGTPGWNPAKQAPAPAAASPATPKPVPPHGTQARYQRHKRAHEKPCEPCRLAELDARKRQREAAAAAVRQPVRVAEVPQSCICDWQWIRGRWRLKATDEGCPWHTTTGKRATA